MNSERGAHPSNLGEELVEATLARLKEKIPKETVAQQIADAMRAKRISKQQMARLMATSRTQIDRLLDPTDGNVTLATLQKAAKVVGGRVRVELICDAQKPTAEPTAKQP